MLGRVMLDLEGYELTLEERELLQHPNIAGIILFSRNYNNREQLEQLIQHIRSLRQPLLIAVDHEGGRVQRFREGFTCLPPAGELGELYQQDAQKALQQAEYIGHLMASELLAVGIDFSFAPVLDIDTGISQVIGDRSFFHQSQEVIQLAGAYIKGMHTAGMSATGKHFPGHGAVIADSHKELPIDMRDWQTIYQHDLQPFSQLKDQLQAIMPAHVVYEKIDPYPANFSYFWLQTILREILQFDGAIISDDLTMSGAATMGSYLERATLASAAGCDMITVCNNRKGAVDILDGLHYQTNPASQKRLLAMQAKVK